MPQLLYKTKPLFGLDIGLTSMKVMQIEHDKKGRSVTGYGVNQFDAESIKDGVIVDPVRLAKSAKELFDSAIIGDITTRRVSFAIPATRTFTRSVMLPKLSKKELDEAVHGETERYIPIPVDELYIDYEIMRSSTDEVEILIVATPKKVVDSYMKFADLTGLEVANIETTIAADSRLFLQAEEHDIPTVLIDFGSLSSDITIYDNTLVVTGTVPGGGDSFTDAIAAKLGVTKREAHIIKSKYGMGLSKKQKEITEGLEAILTQVLKEIRRMIRYYEERSQDGKKIGQIVTLGGGANMPGLSDYLTSNLRLPVRMCDPWQKLSFGRLQPPNATEKSMYITVAGLALVDPEEIHT